MNKKDIKDRIEEFEYNNSGLRYLNGAYAKVVNVRIRKRDRIAYADIMLVKQMDGVTERYNDCEYPFELLGFEEKEKRVISMDKHLREWTLEVFKNIEIQELVRSGDSLNIIRLRSLHKEISKKRRYIFVGESLYRWFGKVLEEDDLQHALRKMEKRPKGVDEEELTRLYELFHKKKEVKKAKK